MALLKGPWVPELGYQISPQGSSVEPAEGSPGCQRLSSVATVTPGDPASVHFHVPLSVFAESNVMVSVAAAGLRHFICDEALNFVPLVCRFHSN